MAKHNIATYTHTHPYIIQTHSFTAIRETNSNRPTHRLNSTPSGHSPFLTVSLNFKIILHFEKLIIDLTKSHTN